MSSEVMERWKRPILIGVAIFCLVVFSITAPTLQMFAGDPQAFDIVVPGGGTVTVNKTNEEPINRGAYGIVTTVSGLLRSFGPTPEDVYEGFEDLEGLAEFRVWLPFEPVDETSRSRQENYPARLDFLVLAMAGESEGIHYSDEYLDQKVVGLVLSLVARNQFYQRIRQQGEEQPPVDLEAERQNLYRSMGLTPDGMRRAMECALVATEYTRRLQVGLIDLPNREEIDAEFRASHPLVAATAAVFGTEAWLEAARAEFEELYPNEEQRREEIEKWQNRKVGEDSSSEADDLTKEERDARRAYEKLRDERIEFIDANVVQEQIRIVNQKMRDATEALGTAAEGSEEAKAHERTIDELERQLAMLNMKAYRLQQQKEEPMAYLKEGEHLKGTQGADGQPPEGTERDPASEFDARRLAFLAITPNSLTDEQVAFMVAELQAAAEGDETFELTLKDEADYFKTNMRTRFLTAEGKRSTTPGPWRPTQGGGGPNGFEVQEGAAPGSSTQEGGTTAPEGQADPGPAAGSTQDPETTQDPGTAQEPEAGNADGEGKQDENVLPSGPKRIPERTLSKDDRVGIDSFPNKDTLAWETVKESRQAYREAVAKRWLEHYRKTAVKEFLEARVAEFEKVLEAAREDLKAKSSDRSTLENRRRVLTGTELMPPGGMGTRDALQDLDKLRSALDLAKGPFDTATERLATTEAALPKAEELQAAEGVVETARQALDAAKAAGTDGEQLKVLEDGLKQAQDALDALRAKEQAHSTALQALLSTQEDYELKQAHLRRYLERGTYRILHRMLRDANPYIEGRPNTLGLGMVHQPKPAPTDADAAEATPEGESAVEPVKKNDLVDAIANLWKQLDSVQKEEVGVTDEAFPLLPTEERASKLLTWIFGTPRNPFVVEGQEIHRLQHVERVRKIIARLDETRKAIEAEALPLLERLAFIENRLDLRRFEVVRAEDLLKEIDGALQAYEREVREATAAGDEAGRARAEQRRTQTLTEKTERENSLAAMRAEIVELEKELPEKQAAWSALRDSVAERTQSFDTLLGEVEDALKAYGGPQRPVIDSLGKRIEMVGAELETLRKAEAASEDTGKIRKDLEELVRFRNEAYDAKRTFEPRFNAEYLKTAYADWKALFGQEKEDAIRKGLSELLEIPEKLAGARAAETQASEALAAAEKTLAEGKLEALRALPTLFDELAKKEEAKGLQLVFVEHPEWMTKKELQRETEIHQPALETKLFGPGGLQKGQLADDVLVSRDYLMIPALVDQPAPGDDGIRNAAARRAYLRDYARQLALHAALVFTTELRDASAFATFEGDQIVPEVDDYLTLEIGVDCDAAAFASAAADPIYKVNGAVPSGSVTFVRSGKAPNYSYRWGQGVVPDWFQRVDDLEIRNLLNSRGMSWNYTGKPAIEDIKEEKGHITVNPVFQDQRETYLVGHFTKQDQPADSQRFKMTSRQFAELFRQIRDRKFGENVRANLSGDALHKLFKDSRYDK